MEPVPAGGPVRGRLSESGPPPPALWGAARVRGPGSPRPPAPCSLGAVWPPGSPSGRCRRGAPLNTGPPHIWRTSGPRLRATARQAAEPRRPPHRPAGAASLGVSQGRPPAAQARFCPLERLFRRPVCQDCVCWPGRQGGQSFPRTLCQSGRLSWFCPLDVRVLRSQKQSAAPHDRVSPCFVAFFCAHHTCTRLGPGTAASRRTWRQGHGRCSFEL